MKIEARINPKYLDDILAGRKTAEYRQVEELILTDGHRALHTRVKAIKEAEDPEAIKKSHPLVPWDPDLPIYAFQIEPIKVEQEESGPWQIRKVRDIKRPEGVFKDIQPLDPQDKKQMAVEVMATQGIQLGAWHLQVVPLENGMALLAEKEGGAVMLVCDGEVRISWDGPGALYERKEPLTLQEQLEYFKEHLDRELARYRTASTPAEREAAEGAIKALREVIAELESSMEEGEAGHD